jgi:N6-adenosine-specific RNA methylase IME4
MTEGLVKFNAAKQALAEAHRIDEAKDIRDKHVAIKAYARQAKDKDLLRHATGIIKRAERRTGELLKEMAERGERDAGQGGDRKSRLHGETVIDEKPMTLADMGISKIQSHRWQALAEQPEDEFEAAVAQAEKEAVASVERTAAERAAEKKARRDAREIELAAKQASFPDKRYGVILADPPWAFKTRSERGMDRSADNHYPTVDLEGIKALDVASIAAPDCALFLWATAPMLPHALEVMAAWGFEYKSHIVWAKLKSGTGYWFMSQHELLLVGTRGRIPAPTPGTQWKSVFHAAATEHSAKPDQQYRLIETYYPNLPKIELNARGKPMDGWDAWGNEAEEAAA